MAIDVKELNAALEQLETQKGISREVVVEALKEAMIKSFKKDIGDDDAIVEVLIDLEAGKIEMYQVKTVVEEVDDELLEIALEDANKNGNYHIGDRYLIYADISNLRKAIVLSIKSLMKQKFAEVEKGILYDQFRDKIGTMITGRVESYDERGATVNIGKASVYMPRKEMIKDERFVVGDTIKIYVVDVAASTKGGAHIIVSRSHEGFLRMLMTEEIHDIYDGTIVIKSIAREAGERSKVAVFCEDPNIDPAGTCIGPNGSRIQKVVSQLGNGASKEKIDIITYSEHPALYIMDALKPAKAVGIKVDEENRTALVVVKDDSLSLAIGKRGINARLAAKLTNYKIDIKIETEALEEGLEFTSTEEIEALELEEKANRIAKAQKESLVYQNGALPGVPDNYVAPQDRTYEEESSNEVDSALEEEADKEEINVSAPSNEEVNETPVEETTEEASETVEEEKAEEAPVEEPSKKEEKEVHVKTTTTIEDLEKSLESESKSSNKNKNNKKKKKSEEEVSESSSTVKNDGPRMSIYTEEELKELEEEEEDIEEDIDDEDIDYDEYDKYYDED